MIWMQKNLGWMITTVALLFGGAIGYGRLCQTASAVQTKADKESVSREMDLTRADLCRIEAKVDRLIEMHIPPQK